MSAIGVIDRDHWPEQYLATLPSVVHALSVHELESLYCVEGVFIAVARHLTKSADEAQALYLRFVQSMRDVDPGLVTKQVAERCKRRLEPRLRELLNNLQPARDLAQFEAAARLSLDHRSWIFDAQSVASEEVAAMTASMAGDSCALLKALPGKSFVMVAARLLGTSADAYKELVQNALISAEAPLQTLRSDLENALRPHLPARVADPVAAEQAI